MTSLFEESLAKTIPHRSVIQIAGVGESLYALCDDGTVWLWQWAGQNDAGWDMVDRIPQPPKTSGYVEFSE